MLKMYKYVMVFAVLCLIIPGVSFAQIQNDSRCFTLEDCVTARKNALGLPDDVARTNPLYQGVDAQRACGGKTKKITLDEKEVEQEVGFCYPATRIVTKTSFAGRNVFANIGEFIQFIYKYGVMISGIVAVIVIIYAGLQYVLSGGAQEKITKSKERIGGALMGLLLVAGSYIILSTINPYLVNLRLPQAWLINQQALGPTYCGEAKNKLSLALSSEEIQTYLPHAQSSIKEDNLKNANYTIKPEDGLCGDQYFIEGRGAQTCNGEKCPKPNQTCYQEPKAKNAKCHNSRWIGTMSNSSILSQSATGQAISEAWEWESGAPTEPNGWANRASIIIVCSNGKFFNVQNGITIPNSAKQNLLYSVYVSDAQIDSATKGSCNDKVKGFIIAFEMNEAYDPIDEWHYIGKIGNSAIDMGDKSAFSVTAKTAPQEYFATTEELKKGIRMDIDAGNIHDIDNTFENGNTKRVQVYGALGFVKAKPTTTGTGSSPGSSTPPPGTQDIDAYSDAIL